MITQEQLKERLHYNPRTGIFVRKTKYSHMNIGDAALVWAEYYNQDDYPLMNETVDIEIEDEAGNKKMFTVGAELDIHYSASEKAA